MLVNRRGILVGLGSLLAAPAVVHAQNLMPVRALRLDDLPSDLWEAAVIAVKRGWKVSYRFCPIALEIVPIIERRPYIKLSRRDVAPVRIPSKNILVVTSGSVG